MRVQINKQENEYSDKRSKNNTNWQRKACKRTWLMHLNLGWVSETSLMKETQFTFECTIRHTICLVKNRERAKKA